MGAGADGRWRGALLAGLALAALAVGGWWWRAAAPVSGPVATAASSPPAVPLPEAPATGERLLIDPENGYILQAPEDESVVLREKSGRTTAEVSHVVWQDRSHLDEGDAPLVRQSAPSDNLRYLLMVTCSGSGVLTVSLDGSRDDGPGQRIPCSGSPMTIELVSAGGPLLVRFAVADGEVDLDARLLGLF